MHFYVQSIPATNHLPNESSVAIVELCGRPLYAVTFQKRVRHIASGKYVIYIIIIIIIYISFPAGFQAVVQLKQAFCPSPDEQDDWRQKKRQNYH